jgi:hypothetical protein
MLHIEGIVVPLISDLPFYIKKTLLPNPEFEEFHLELTTAPFTIPTYTVKCHIYIIMT